MEAWNSTSAYAPSADAPPPYYSVVGGTQQAGRFTFVDFLPECSKPGGFFSEPQYETFSALVDKANNWLRMYPGWELITCESVEFSSKSQSCNSEKMIYLESGEMYNYYIRGLRLWIRERSQSGNPQQIGYLNLIPEKTNSGGIFSHPKFESLLELVNRFNSMNRMNPIPGRILTVESQEIKTGNWNVKADRSNWYEKGDMQKYFVFIIRIFYEIMPAQLEEIGMADFLPDIVESGGIFSNPKYEPFSNVVRKASDWWAMQQSGLRFCNAQSLEIRIKRGDINTHRMEYVESGSMRSYYSRILRLAYVRSLQGNMDYGIPSSIRRLTCKTFVPVQLEQSVCTVKFETLSQTKERVSAWIRATGAHVISAETAALRFRSGGEAKYGPEATYTYNVAERMEYWIYVIRLYLNDDYREPPPQMLPPVPEIVDTGCCVIL